MRLHPSKHGAHRAHHISRALALCAGVHLAVFASAAVAVRAGYLLLDLEFLGGARKYFVKCYPNTKSQVGTLELLLSASSASAKSEGTSESMPAKDVAEHAEDILHVHAGSASAESSGTVKSGMAKLVVALTLFGVA